MKGRMLFRGIAPLVVAGFLLALAACATAPPQELSIVDAIHAQGFNMTPQSCAAMDAATVCVKTTRLDKNNQCSCADRTALANGQLVRY